MDKKATKLFEQIMKHIDEDQNCVWLRDTVRSICAAKVSKRGAPSLKGKSHKQLAALAIKAFLVRRDTLTEMYDEAPNTGIIGAGEIQVLLDPYRDGKDYLMLPIEDFSPLWDHCAFWGDRIYTDHDFSMDPNQDIVKVNFQFSTLDEQMSNESIWVKLHASQVNDDGSRAYIGIMHNKPATIDFSDEEDNIFDEDGLIRVVIPAEAIMCVFDDDAREREDFESNSYRKEGVVPSQPTIH